MRQPLHLLALWLGNVRLLQAQAHSVHPGLEMAMRIRRAKWRVRCMVYGVSLGEFHRAMRHPLLQDILDTHPRLYEKVYRPYLICGLAPKIRARLVCDHYRLALGRLGETALRAIYLQGGLEIAVLHAGGNTYTARLGYVDQFEKEGELTLELLNLQGGRVYSASLSLIQLHDGPLGAVIGCLQGPQLQAGDAQALIKQMTKALHGLRPKAFMITLIQMFCSALGVQRLFGVGNARHAYHCILNKRRRVKMNYDAIWAEMGGRMSTHLAEIPVQPHHRRPDEIKTHKRSQYARRYALMEDLQAQIGSRFGDG
jgi:uncharacterized protein VirK/YbjX